MISIIIPIYNDEKYIVQCLDSIINQTYKDFEVLCMDDGSTDNTVSILNSYAEKDHRFKIFPNTHKGPGWQRNFGIENSNGDYITFMDHDDIVDPIWLEKLYKTLIVNNVDVACCCYRKFNEEENSVQDYICSDKFTKLIEIDLNTIPEELVGAWFAPWRRLVRKELLLNNDVRFAVGKFKFDDVLFTEELFLNAKSVIFTKEVLYYHRMFSDSITGEGTVNKDIYFEHFDTVDELVKYCQIHNKNPKPLLIKMYSFFESYLNYVTSTDEFYKRLKAMVYENHLPAFIKQKLFLQKLKITKRKIVASIRKVK